MRFKRVLLMCGLGAGSGALAAWIAYQFREPSHLSPLNVTVDQITLSDELWAIIGLTLLGALVCGTIAMAYVSRKGASRVLTALLVAAPLGAFLCWGSRWVMDQIIYSQIGGPEKRIELEDVSRATQLPWLVWQLCVALGLTMPVVLAIGPNRFTFVRGLIGSALVLGFGYAMSFLVSILLIAMLLPLVVSGGAHKADASDFGRIADVLYLFSLGAATGLAFAVAEAIWKPAWLKSFSGPTEGRTWTLGEHSRIGSMEGVEVFVPNDGRTAAVHAQIEAVEDGHWISDLVGSTTLNGQPARGAWLTTGDRIGIGSHQLIFYSRVPTGGRPATRTVEPVVAPSPTPAATAAPQSTPKTSQDGFCLVDPLGNRHILKTGKTVIGRDASCDLALTWESTMSRRHAELSVEPNGILVKDLGSTNGSFVNEQKVDGAAPLKIGDTLRLGACRLNVEKS